MDTKQIKTPQRATQTARRVIGQRIKKRRKELRITQKELGRMVYKADVSIRQYERGLHVPDMTTQMAIANALQCKHSDLFSVDAICNTVDIKTPHKATQTAIPTSYIHALIVQPENAGDKSRVLSWLLRKWENESELFVAPTEFDDDLK